VRVVDADGNEVFAERIIQFYSRDWSNIIVELLGNRVLIHDRRGRLKFDEIINELPAAGGIVFETSQSNDLLYVDDCLFAATTASTTAEADFAFEILDLMSNPARRPFRVLLTDWDENFDDQFRTRGWWESDVGEYVVDRNDPDHTFYFELSSETDQPVSRRIRREIDQTFRVFGDGRDRSQFTDSTDLYVKVDIRLPEEAPVGSTAVVGIRSQLNASRTGLDQYQVELVKEADGTIRARARPFLQADKTYVFDEVLSGVVAGDWVEVILISEDDRVAFFANGRFLATVRPATVLGGTLAIGVEGNSLAHFDDLIIRDATVNE
jgi:hypothetical protein